MARDIEGMGIIVTGGGSGIGEATACHFAALGARVTICGRRAEKVHAVASSLGERCRAVVADVTVDDDRRLLLATALAHGRGRLDVLVNNAGNMYRAPVEALEEQRLHDILASNVVAPMMLTGLAVDALTESRGCVVFVGSVHTQRAFPGASPYAVSKAAVETLTGVLAAELGGRGIRVGCVRPGAVSTELNVRAGLGTPAEAAARLEGLSGAHALQRIGSGAEIAEAIAYLAAAEWTTGGVVAVDGGLGLGVTDA